MIKAPHVHAADAWVFVLFMVSLISMHCYRYRNE